MGVELGLAVVGITVGAGTGTLVGLPGCGDGAGVGRGVGLADGLDVGCGLVGCEEGAAVGLGVGFDDGYAEAVVGSEVDGFGLGAIDGGADGALDGVDVGDGAGRALGDGEGSDVGQKVGPLVGLSVSTMVVSTLTTDWGEMKSCAAADSSRRREPAIQLSSVVCAMRSEAQSPESTFDWKNALSASLTV